MAVPLYTYTSLLAQTVLLTVTLPLQLPLFLFYILYKALLFYIIYKVCGFICTPEYSNYVW